MPAAAFDVAQLAGLLRRAPSICTGCAAVKLVLHVDRVVAALAELSRTVKVHQGAINGWSR